jgi:acyl-CoA thioester hydrolase
MLDALHMLHNAAYIVLFERARLEMRMSLMEQYGEEVFDWPFYVARNEIDYITAIYKPQVVSVEVVIAQIGRTSTTFHQRIRMPDGSIAAEGMTVLVRVDAETRRPVPWSETYRERVAPYIGELPQFGQRARS